MKCDCGISFLVNILSPLLILGHLQNNPCPSGLCSHSQGCKNCSLSLCPAGYFSNSTASSTCLPCPAGTFSNISGQNQCQNCPSGYISLSGSVSCFPCPPGTYSRLSTCNQCPIGTVCPRNACSICEPCGPGLQANGSTSCKPCAPGFFKASNTSTFCSKCAPGCYTLKFRSRQCSQCPSGFFCECPMCSPQHCPGHRICPAGTSDPESCAFPFHEPSEDKTSCSFSAVGISTVVGLVIIMTLLASVIVRHFVVKNISRRRCETSTEFSSLLESRSREDPVYIGL